MKQLIVIFLFLSSLSMWSQTNSEVDFSNRKVDSCLVFAPNTPNDYFQNTRCTYRYWGIMSNCLIEDFYLIVYNRWGEKLFETHDQNENWDTNDHAEGVYAWILTGKTYLENEFEMRGLVTVVK